MNPLVLLLLAIFYGACSQAPQPSDNRAHIPTAQSLSIVKEDGLIVNEDKKKTEFLSANRTPFYEVQLKCSEPPRELRPRLVQLARDGLSVRVADELRADLDGDGLEERIRVHVPPRSRSLRGHVAPSDSSKGFGNVVLAIGDDAQLVHSGIYEGVRIVDFDPSDKDLHVVVDGLESRIFGYDGERIVRLAGGSRVLWHKPKRSENRVSFAILKKRVMVLFQFEGDELRAQYPAHTCGLGGPGMGVTSLDEKHDLANDPPDWLISIGGGVSTGPKEQTFGSFLVVSKGPDGLVGVGPFPMANRVEVSGPDTFTVTHWHCGELNTAHWQRVKSGFKKISDLREGKTNPKLCSGPVQLFYGDLDGDGKEDRIVLSHTLVAVNDAVVGRLADADSLSGEIVDTGKRGKRKKFVVVHDGPYDGDERTFVYTYDGDSLSESTR